jgi:hypothetical protein
LPWKKFKDNVKIREINAQYIHTPDLLDTIEDIYLEKYKFDIHCKKNAKSRNSMSQYLFLFFRNKSESNNQAIESVYNFINSLFINISNVDLALFASILQNEIEEEYAGVYYKIKAEVQDLLTKFYKEKYESEKRPELKENADMMDGLIPFEVAMLIINNLYTSDHPFINEIKEKVDESVLNASKKKALTESMMSKSKKFKYVERKKKEEEEEPPKFLLYSELEKIILTFELKNHRIFLSYLSSEFKKIDLDNYGYISRKKFILFGKNLFKKLNKKVDSKKLLMRREGYDPFVITYSDIVKIFTKKKIKHKNEFQNLVAIMNDSLLS